MRWYKIESSVGPFFCWINFNHGFHILHKAFVIIEFSNFFVMAWYSFNLRCFVHLFRYEFCDLFSINDFFQLPSAGFRWGFLMFASVNHYFIFRATGTNRKLFVLSFNEIFCFPFLETRFQFSFPYMSTSYFTFDYSFVNSRSSIIICHP